MSKRVILLGLTGSVATVLYEKLIEELRQLGDVYIILTPSAEHFVSKDFNGLKVFRDTQEWTWVSENGETTDKWKKNDPVLHIKLRDIASALVIAPCSMNTLAKISNGICDNLLTSIARAWDFNRPFIIAPAANTHMWEHPITQRHIRDFVNFSSNNRVIPPQEKMLACNTFGMGAMANIDIIKFWTQESLRWMYPFIPNYPRTDGIPVEKHPGAFKAIRKNSIHTGVDLYADVGEAVYPVETGKVVAVEPFTGPKDNSPWWLDTDCVLVEGATGVVCYGEVDPKVKVGQTVFKGKTVIGTVLRVVPPTSPQHPELPGWKPSMLHMELYPHGHYKPSDGYGECFSYLQDPTPYLQASASAPTTLFKV